MPTGQSTPPTLWINVIPSQTSNSELWTTSRQLTDNSGLRAHLELDLQLLHKQSWPKTGCNRLHSSPRLCKTGLHRFWSGCSKSGNSKDRLGSSCTKNEQKTGLNRTFEHYLKEKGTPPLCTALADWTLDDEIILYQGKSYIPPDTYLRRDIICEFHKSPSSGHPGFFKTLCLLKEHYWWPRMSTMVKQFIDRCTACQQMKLDTHPTAVPLMQIKSHAHWPFQQITMDFITDLPPSDGFDSIFIVVSQGLTKGVILMPCNKTITAAETANLYIHQEHIYALWTTRHHDLRQRTAICISCL